MVFHEAKNLAMRELTKAEVDLIDRRRARFDLFLEERMPMLTEFMQLLELPNPAFVLVEADKYLPALDQWLKGQVIDSSDDVWILTRLGYFVGEYLVQRLRGCWFLNEVIDSKYFAHYVAGQFGEASNHNAMVDPFVVAEAYIAEPPGRSLTDLLLEVELEIARA
jgi:hypothetical protein